MYPRLTLAAAVLAAFAAVAGKPTISAAVQVQLVTVNGFVVDRYTWRDSRNRPRSVSLKRQGNGNPGNGGYAVQMTYQVNNGGVWQTITANAPAGEGFGYFVSHERYRTFTDGSYNTIARRVFGVDDSPLGRGFPVVGRRMALANPNAAAHRFTQNYPRYGTVNPIAKGPDGEDVSPTPIAPAQNRLYQLPITLTWYFEDGKDYPRIVTVVSMENIPGPDRVNFDVRGPYGVLQFDNNQNRVITGVAWADRYFFRSLASPLTRNRNWNWNAANQFGRYNAMFAGGFEMGLYEPRRFASSALVHGFAFGRAKTSANYSCAAAGNVQRLPCDWEWPYQGAQYSLPYDNLNGTTNYKKIAWGSAPYYGTGPSLTRVYDSSTTYQDFNGFPADRRIAYSTCVVLGRTIENGLTRAAARMNNNCAAISP